MVTIHPFQPEHIAIIGEAVHDNLSLPSLLAKPDYAIVLGKIGPAFTAFYGDVAIGSGGIAILWPGHGQVWAYIGRSAVGHALGLLAMNRGMKLIIKERNLHRLTAQVLTGDNKAERWIKRLGFSWECDMKKYGIKGETYSQYSLLTEVA